MTSLREFFSLPFGSRGAGEDTPVGVDELGRTVYEDARGQRYVMTEAAPITPGDIRGAIAGGAQAFADDPVGAGGNALAALAAAAWNGIEAPANALRGDYMTYGDVADTALDWGVLGAAGSAPQGALRAGGLATDAAETPAQTVARLLREGRASEVTDDLMAQADDYELFRLYESGATGMDMPMDEASRMARAREMEFDNIGYHGTPRDFAAFDTSAPSNSGVRSNAVWSSASPQVAQTYGDNVMPLMGNQGWPAEIDFDGRSTAFFDNRGHTPRELAQYLQEVRDNAARYGAEIETDLAWDLQSAGVEPMYVDEIGGVIMRNVDDSMSIFGGDVATNYATFDPRNIRSRFARFDPRLSHLANLSAGVAAAGVALPYLADDERADLNALRAYIEGY